MGGEESSTSRKTAIDIGTGLAGAGVGLLVGGPAGAFAGAAIAPATRAAVNRFVGAYDRYTRARVETVLQLAAERAGVSVEDLMERLDADPMKRELFVRTLRVAQDTSLDKQLIALAKALSYGAQTADQAAVLWEQSFVSALGELTPAHIQILLSFTKTSNELALGDGSVAFDRPVENLNDRQIKELIFPGLEQVVDSILATIESHGLVRSKPEGAGTYGGGGSNVSEYRITVFGRTVLERLELISKTIAGLAEDERVDGHGQQRRR